MQANLVLLAGGEKRENGILRSITGWVRNMADGTVEMEAQGNPDKLDQLFATIKKGNFIIKVDNIDCTEIDCVEETSFIIKY